MFPDEPNDEEKLEKLPEDYQTPFRPADPTPTNFSSTDGDDSQQSGSTLDDTHPVTDTNLDPQELYDEGISGGAEASEPNEGNTVIGYRSEEDSQEQS